MYLVFLARIFLLFLFFVLCTLLRIKVYIIIKYSYANFERTNKKYKRPVPTRTRCGIVRGTWRQGRRRQGRRDRRTCSQNASHDESARRSWDSLWRCRRQWSAGSWAGWRRGPAATMRPRTGHPVADLLHLPRSSSYSRSSSWSPSGEVPSVAIVQLF